MLSIKRKFENNDTLPEQLRIFISDRLQKEGFSEAGTVNTANLIDSIAALMTAKAPTFLGTSVQKTGGNIIIRLVSDGVTYNPLDELDILSLMDSEPPLPDPDFDTPLPKEQLLRALRNSLSYYRRNNLNEVEFVAKKSQPQTLQRVTIAFLLAIAVGMLLRFFGSDTVNTLISMCFLSPVRTMFLNALKMLVVPVVFFCIASSMGGVSDIREYGRIGGKVLLFYTATSFFAVLAGFLIYRVLQPGASVNLDLSAYSYVASPSSEISILDTIVNIIPSSFVGAFTNMEMLQIIFLALLTGIAANRLNHGGDRQKVTEFLSLCNRLFLQLASLVMMAIPIATFCAMALLVLTIDGTMIVALIKLVLGMMAGIVCMFVFYGLVFMLFTRQDPRNFFRKCVPSFISFLTFCSTSAVMPQSLDTCTKKLGISSKICSFSMPLGSTINMDGTCIYLILSTLFLAAVYHVPVTADMLLKMIVTVVILSMGAPPISGGGFICLSILVTQIGVPIESLGILMGIDQLMSMCRTLINGTGDFTGTAVVASSEGLMDYDIYHAI